MITLFLLICNVVLFLFDFLIDLEIELSGERLR